MNLPRSPAQAPLCVVALRRPTTDKWIGPITDKSLYGSEEDFIHLNCLSLIVAALINDLFGIPLVWFFEDSGGDSTGFLSKILTTDFTERMRMFRT